MKIDKRLNLVIPIEEGGGTMIYVHTMPPSSEVFEQYYLLISKTFAAIWGEGLNEISGPRVAAMLMRDIAKRMNVNADMLFEEFRRLSSVIMPGAAGFETLPMRDVVQTGRISKEDLSEIDNAIAFFSVASSMHRRADQKAFLEGAAGLWGAQVTLSTPTEFADSLAMSKQTDGTTPKESPSFTTSLTGQATTALVQ